MPEYRDFLFVDHYTGEEFAVEVKVTTQTDEEAKDEAIDIAMEWFIDPDLVDEVDPFEIEIMGIDVY